MPTYACLCGQKFAGENLAGTVIVCEKCGRHSRIPGAVTAPPVAPSRISGNVPPPPVAPPRSHAALSTPPVGQLPSDLLDDLAASQQPPPSDDSATTTKPKKKRRQPSLPTSSRSSATTRFNSRIAIDWNRFLPAALGLLVVVALGMTVIVAAPSWWASLTAPPRNSTSSDGSSVANNQPVEPSWSDTYFNRGVYTLPPDAVDQPVAPQATSGVRREPNAHHVEQGMELRIDVQKSFPTTDSLVYSLAAPAPEGATIDPSSGIIAWKPALDYPPGVIELLVQRTFADKRPDGGILYKVQVLPSLGPPSHVGPLAPDDPIQAETRRKPIKFRGATVYPLADYSLTAVVLSSKFYTTGEEANFSPIDLALGWGCMSDESLLRRMEVSQGDRRYAYQYSGAVDVTAADMSRSSANTHIIPSTTATAELLASVKRGDVVRLSGALVEVKRQYWKWRSSLVRTDTGDGACEVMWVDHAEIMRKPSE